MYNTESDLLIIRSGILQGSDLTHHTLCVKLYSMSSNYRFKIVFTFTTDCEKNILNKNVERF